MNATVANRYPSAILLSALLHGAVIAVLLFLTYFVRHQVADAPRIIELIQGEGDNPGATVAAAQGTSSEIKVTAPEPVKAEAPPVPEPVAPAAPLEAVPTPKPVVDPASKITKAIQTIERKDRQQTTKIRTDEQRKAKEEAAREKLTKEQYDKLNKSNKAPAPTKSDPLANVPKVGTGIAKGVAGGSMANTTGGMGGKALTSQETDQMLVYDTAFKQRLRDALEPPPGLSDSLVAKVVVTIAADGRISGASIVKSSGSEEFDRAVLAAIARVQMGPRPDHRTGQVSFDLKLHDISG